MLKVNDELNNKAWEVGGSDDFAIFVVAVKGITPVRLNFLIVPRGLGGIN